MGYPSELDEPRIAPTVPPEESRKSASARVLKARWPLIIIVAAVVGIATYLVARLVPAEYTSSADLVVEIYGSGSNPDQATTAANSDAGQYAQDATAQAVLAGAARKLSPADAAGLSTAVSGGTVASQNIVQVSATGKSAGQAQRRAEAVREGLATYVNARTAAEERAYVRAARAGLSPIIAEINSISQQLARAPKADLASGRYLALQTTLSTLIAGRASATAAIAQNASTGQPSLTLLNSAGAGSKTSPKPPLYAAVGFLVALIVMWQLLLAFGPRSRR